MAYAISILLSHQKFADRGVYQLSNALKFEQGILDFKISIASIFL
jgi:hypothetical protein